jgi:hypothetical protein
VALGNVDASPVSDRLYLARDAGSLTGGNTYTATGQTSDGSNYFCLGAEGALATTGAPSTAGSNVGITGELAHVIMCDTVLSTSDWQAARDFVNAAVSAF